ncbi:hypothetical protein [Kribbella sancticallisti]
MTAAAALDAPDELVYRRTVQPTLTTAVCLRCSGSMATSTAKSG